MEFRVVCDCRGTRRGLAGARAKVRQSSHRRVQCGAAAVTGDAETNARLFLRKDGED